MRASSIKDAKSARSGCVGGVSTRMKKLVSSVQSDVNTSCKFNDSLLNFSIPSLFVAIGT
jgi:hypothetical protein